MEQTDVLIIGGGPAGMTAALYAARKGLSVTVVSTDLGGQMLLTSEIENYPGFASVSGFALADSMEAQTRAYPVRFVTAGVTSLERDEDGFLARLDDGKEERGRASIVTAGRRPRRLGIPGEEILTGRGVSYCATCDGPFYRNKVVAVAGGGDSAVQAAIELSGLAEKVFLLVRSRLRASEILVKRMKEKNNIEILTGWAPVEVKGEKKVSAVVIRNGDEQKEISVEGLFVEAGGLPNNAFLPAELEQNGAGEIKTDKAGRTNIPGLFAAGDVTDGPYKQVVIAAGQGAAAALAAHEYLLGL